MISGWQSGPSRQSRPQLEQQLEQQFRQQPPGQGLQRLLVSIHDVTPALEDEVHTLWHWCRSFDIVPALFVVPDWHGAWPLERHASFVQWIRHAQMSGADILLHGERHDEVGSPRTLKHEWQALGRTAGEGEFLTLEPEVASDRIARGMDRLHALGLRPIGFVPPAWLAPMTTHHAVQELSHRFPELRCSEDVSRVYAPAGMSTRTPVVRWSGRTPTRARMSHLLAWWHRRWLRSSPLVRIALHPQDLHHSLTARSVRQSLEHWSRRRTPVTYRSLCQ